ncbi:rhodanese-like domain-containing protein [Roseomonas genomospecies 6]|uniref:MBL fold metallo-hydrolase n=1 Tax=Roseomonas genomospecies 6 TaxID=214106 RepID=A0A9W7NID5_9PROT|nr:MBL fold metallo-hydrolase [Roseomonas genomospecies 6]KAA0679526.1 MBL fold metallo-hydrolase [Roseomonas genomospecies 6]
MGLVLGRIEAEGIAQLSYLIGDDAAGVAAVIDPRRDVDVYLETARRRGVRIVHIVETHIHADFVSGACELAARTGAAIHGGRSEDYRFNLHQLSDGAEIGLGTVRLRALHTPGHTPEHISLLAFDAKQGEEPFAIFTGDTLFNLDVGRPDLLGDGSEQRLAKQLYRSLFELLVPLGDRVEVYPGHGAGSSCGRAIGDRNQSTIGNERTYSEALRPRSEDEFVRWMLGGMPEPPRHYARLKKVNAAGPPLRGGLPVVVPLPPEEFRERASKPDTLVLDTRSILAFGGGHVPGTLNIALRPEFPTWVGWMVDPDRELLLIVESERDLALVVEHLYRLGYDNIGGHLLDGMTSWQNAGFELAHVGQWTVQDLNRHRQDGDLIVLDVRTDEEWAEGHVPGARHIYVPHLAEHLNQLDRDKAVATYCGTGYRASIAASLLKRRGFREVINVPGSWTAWKAANLPVESPKRG